MLTRYMFNIQNNACIPRRLKTEKNKDRSTFHGRAGGRRKLN